MRINIWEETGGGLSLSQAQRRTRYGILPRSPTSNRHLNRQRLTAQQTGIPTRSGRDTAILRDSCPFLASNDAATSTRHQKPYCANRTSQEKVEKSARGSVEPTS